MIKKKILFVFLDFHKGGVPTSFSSIFEACRDEFDINVLPLRDYNDCRYPFKKAFIHSPLLLRSCYNTTTSCSGFSKLALFMNRLVYRLFLTIGVNVNNFIVKSNVRNIEREGKYDLVVSFQDRITAQFCQFFDCDKIAWLHYDYARWNAQYNDDDTFLSKYRKIICVSDFTKNNLIKKYPSLSGNVISQYNLFDSDRIISLAKLDADHSDFKTDDFTILTIGRIVLGKRVEQIPRIASELSNIGCKFCWYIIGSGSNEMENQIRNEIQKYGVNGCVKMLGFQSNPYSYLYRSNLLVSLSESEACPMIFNEAKILGIPVASTDFGSSYEFIHNDIDGVICSINNIVDAISRFISDKSYYQRIISSSTLLCINNDMLKEQLIKILKE